MTDRRKQLTKMLLRIEQQLNEAEALTVQPGDDLRMMEWTLATLTKTRTSIRRLQQRLRHGNVEPPQQSLVPLPRLPLDPVPHRKACFDGARR